MNIENTFTGSATYSPEDNKLRLYIGRVPRDEYLKLKADGWQALYKQREAGQGDFAATWTPSRRDTALEYAGIIEDEDAGPAERAADRAERFSGYRDKRTTEAGGMADKYEAGPSAHGFQNQARAERAAARHDRQADRAGDAWGKAEYWTRRTAGVISHALYKSTPGVRMGRIKIIEADLRRDEKTNAEYAERFEAWRTIAAMTDAEKQTALAEVVAGAGYGRDDYQHPRTGKTGSLWGFIREDAADRITGAEAAALYMAKHRDPLKPEFNETSIADWINHYKLRLAYENQMCEAAGGRAALVEMVAGGFIGSHQIQKVNKSSVTGQVVSVAVNVRTHGRDRWGNEDKSAPEFRPMLYNIERLKADAYRAPSEDELAAFNTARKAAKAAAPKIIKPPLINPTDADAERLQAIWNKSDREPSEVLRMTQAGYAARSSGGCSMCETVVVSEHGTPKRDRIMYDKSRAEIFKVRRAFGGGFNRAYRVVILTDKPQKPLPFDAVEAARAALPTVESMLPRINEIAAELQKPWLDKANRALLEDAAYVGWVDIQSMSQIYWTEAGAEVYKAHKAEFETAETINA